MACVLYIYITQAIYGQFVSSNHLLVCYWQFTFHSSPVPSLSVSVCFCIDCVTVCIIEVQVQVKLSFIVIPLHVGAYSGTKRRASQDHGAT